MLLKEEYGFVWTQEYQDYVDEIIEKIRLEYPLIIKEIDNKSLGFLVHGLLIHTINYSRQIKLKGDKWMSFVEEARKTAEYNLGVKEIKQKVYDAFKNRVEQITLHCKDEILVHNQVILLQDLSNELKLEDGE